MDGPVQNSKEQKRDLQSEYVSPHSLSRLVWIIIVVPLLYVLSVGPAVRHYDYIGRRMPNAIEAFEWRLKFVHFPPLLSCCHWYTDQLWCAARTAPVATAH